MEWTKEARYRELEDVTKEELTALEKIVNECPWRQTYHIQPITGLLNDPNGFSYYNGEYHLFYQWFPLGPVHGLKHWYHTKSKDLVHWENIGVAIKPSNQFDSHGVYSGSAIEHEGNLFLIYTGNTRNEKWERFPYQCLAVMDQNGKVTKMDKPIVNEVPKGYTDHFRDPKVWKQDGHYYAIIGAQKESGTGCVVLYRSSDLKEWIFAGEIDTGLKDFGYMWECPDYFELGGQGILLFSPQGLESKGDHFQNIYQSGYVIGSPIDLQKKQLIHGEFQELDRGFDFYAPQTMNDPQGRRILVGWMGLPEIDYPTDRNGWAHCLTLPRELLVREGKLYQKPVKELENLRGEKSEAEITVKNEFVSINGFSGEAYELFAEFSEITAQEFGIEVRVGEHEKTIIKYDSNEKKVIFDRSHSGQSVGKDFGDIRKCRLDAKTVTFQVFVDISSVEVFVNNGEEVLTGRIFPQQNSRGIQFFAVGGQTNLKAMKWNILKD
ncbi:glycoside hydrolase family 32 protein [Niallia endozanthoxylica]|uniref:Sucrose-6-phosphate hydrolase n=1 Tax=Niallia endozanthoxylica TaxID=2036016 RepID=A0A5J5HA62_9BACI|nr:sucrose-6-phosphate hydrolase [Niallia endozanthoxylica]KAA9016462.1 sucrose-6-phosphate hydrolase [Niallia endozanthoxylica]